MEKDMKYVWASVGHVRPDIMYHLDGGNGEEWSEGFDTLAQAVRAGRKYVKEAYPKGGDLTIATVDEGNHVNLDMRRCDRVKNGRWSVLYNQFPKEF
jgi:hypothetical protein